MKKLIFCLLLLVIFFIGCNRGNPTVPPVNDLSDLVGVWIVNLNITDESNETDRLVTIYTITTKTVIQESGSHLAWQYDGEVLTLSGEENYYCWKHGECDVNFTIQIPIEAGDQMGIINGTGYGSLGDVVLTGTMNAWTSTMIQQELE